MVDQARCGGAVSSGLRQVMARVKGYSVQRRSKTIMTNSRYLPTLRCFPILCVPMAHGGALLCYPRAGHGLCRRCLYGVDKCWQGKARQGVSVVSGGQWPPWYRVETGQLLAFMTSKQSVVCIHLSAFFSSIHHSCTSSCIHIFFLRLLSRRVKPWGKLLTSSQRLWRETCGVARLCGAKSWTVRCCQSGEW